MGGKVSNHLRKALRNFGAVRNWQLLLILIPLVFVTATLLRLDHITMTKLRTAVIEADALDDDAAIEQSLIKLRDFVFSHIVVNMVENNGVQSITFGTGPFYLEHQYLRAANAAIAAAEAELADGANPNGDIYATVSATCSPLMAQGNYQNYLSCWTSELSQYPASDNLETSLAANIPSTELYRHNYASPVWAPTWAGWAILACIIILIIIVVRLLIWVILQLALQFTHETS